jgi:hypothetical protein
MGKPKKSIYEDMTPVHMTMIGACNGVEVQQRVQVGEEAQG